MVSVTAVWRNSADGYMEQALQFAQQAFKQGEIPVGAVVIDADGKVLAQASNRTMELGCQTGHAELLAIQQACKEINDWRLGGCWLFVTLQPCMMCFGLASLSRLAGIYYGASSSLFGFVAEPSVLPLAYRDLVIISGIKEESCAAILTEFFANARKSRKIR